MSKKSHAQNYPNYKMSSSSHQIHQSQQQNYYQSNHLRQKRQLEDFHMNSHGGQVKYGKSYNPHKFSSGGHESRFPDSGLMNMLSGPADGNYSQSMSDESSQDNLGPLIENEKLVEEYFTEKEIADKNRFNTAWMFSEDYLKNSTPSRRHGISYEQELEYRRKGTTFIRDMTKLLKHKLLCKETAYLFFHRFYTLRSFKQFEPLRMALACFYLASKSEDHPLPKEHLIQVYNLLVNNHGNHDAKALKKDDTEYIEYCDRLITDENILLQVLGFGLTTSHFAVKIMELASERKAFLDLYKVAFNVATEMNRLTILCLQYPGRILASVSIYLAALYKNQTLPSDWHFSISIHQESDSQEKIEKEKILIVKIADQHRDLLASSQIIRKMLSPEYINRFHKTKNINEKSDNSGQQNQLSGLLNFSPDSAYSSSSSNAATYSPANIPGKSTPSFSKGHFGSSANLLDFKITEKNTLDNSGANMNKIASAKQVNIPSLLANRQFQMAQNSTSKLSAAEVQKLPMPKLSDFINGPDGYHCINRNASSGYNLGSQPQNDAAAFSMSSIGANKRLKSTQLN